MKTILTILITSFVITLQAQKNYIGYTPQQLTDTFTSIGYKKVDSLCTTSKIVFVRNDVKIIFQTQQNRCTQYSFYFPAQYTGEVLNVFNTDNKYKQTNKLSYTNKTLVYLFFFDKTENLYRLKVLEK